MRLLRTALLIAPLLIFLATTPVQAVNPDEILADPTLEARARQLSKGLRCVVCRNQSIDDSNSGIAGDMRVALRERLVAGDSDAEAMQYLVDRYGEFILLKPPFGPATYLLWGTPLLILLLTAWGFSGLWHNRSRAPSLEDPISPEDQAYITSILESEEDPK